MTTQNQASVSPTHASSAGHTFAEADWLDTHFIAMQPEYEEMLRWVGIQLSWHVLDAACGNGSFLPLLTELVGAAGQISAIDLAPENVQVVEGRARQSGWPAPVVAQAGSILALPYADQSFDAVWCANTTQYLSDEELAVMLKEFRRVVRPGGLIAIKEYDMTALQFQPLAPTLIFHLQETLAAAGDRQSHGTLRAIQLPQWLRSAGLVDLRQKPTLMLRLPPLREVEKQLFRDYLRFCYLRAQKITLPAGESQTWQALADVDSPDHILNHPDFQYRAIQTVFVGIVP
ncbi:MAG: class I SAM-dependent methyltransferase [Caldilineaceae bacterium]